ncbi:MAG: hypothetical protein JSV66_14715 [Trueperaceae bacterium]|nr:MAG: hypothetical protein JSV66_14715 [Trueperaceae bacterium]
MIDRDPKTTKIRLVSPIARWLGNASPITLCGLALATLLSLALGQSPLSGGSAPARWIAPKDNDGLVALLADGTVVSVSADGVSVLARSWQSDSLVPCGDDFLGIDSTGRIAQLESGLTGPEVSPHSTPACLPSGGIGALSKDADALLVLDERLEPHSRTEIDALPDAELVVTQLRDPASYELALLTDPTTRYQHGVLGDLFEAASLSVFDAGDASQLASYTLPRSFVFEQRRVTPVASGLLTTRSSGAGGAGVVLFELEGDTLRLVAEGPDIGLGHRWLNLFGSSGGRAYSVRTPHIGGPLERYTIDPTEPRLEVERFQLGVTNHRIGDRNLDLGILLPPEDAGADLLALPSRDLRSIHLIRCDPMSCRIETVFSLRGRLSSNLAFTEGDGGLELLAADNSHNYYRFPIRAK